MRMLSLKEIKIDARKLRCRQLSLDGKKKNDFSICSRKIQFLLLIGKSWHTNLKLSTMLIRIGTTPLQLYFRQVQPSCRNRSLVSCYQENNTFTCPTELYLTTYTWVPLPIAIPQSVNLNFQIDSSIDSSKIQIKTQTMGREKMKESHIMLQRSVSAYVQSKNFIIVPNSCNTIAVQRSFKNQP